ncbi:unnamed protein product [Blepharisma stoltei]|uniref:Uncharacterized protein n=1 Tax=Blepharisma stoltei TaxID=1481888 RepID=A0AAU9JIG9_9CILI|nr:unnamed protein product [Blepharisma stoltei]
MAEELKQDSRKMNSLCKIPAFHLPISQYYQDNSCYYQSKLFHLIDKDDYDWTDWVIFDTESGREQLKAPDALQLLDWGACITQLPNGELFCFGRYILHQIFSYY